MRRFVGSVVVALGAGVVAVAADPPADEFSPAWFGLPGEVNRLSATQSELRAYKVAPNADGKWVKLPTAEQAAAGYPKFIKPGDDYQPAADEVLEYHGGVDVTSRTPDDKPTPQEFKAGVYGQVLEADPKDKTGKVVVQVDDRGNTVEFFHLTAPSVVPGQRLTPDTVVGVTGSKAANAVHLHVQAKNKRGQVLDAREVVTYARKPPATRPQPAWFAPVPRTPDEVPPPAAADAKPVRATSSTLSDPVAAMTQRIEYLDSQAKRYDGYEKVVIDETAALEAKTSGCRGRAKVAAEAKAAAEAGAAPLAERKAALAKKQTALAERKTRLDAEQKKLDAKRAELDRTKARLSKAERKEALDKLNAEIEAFAGKKAEYDRDAAGVKKETAEFNAAVDGLKKKAKDADAEAAKAAAEEKKLAAEKKKLDLRTSNLAAAKKKAADERAELQKELDAEKTAAPKTTPEGKK